MGGASVIGNARAEGRNAAEYSHALMFKPTVTWSRISSGKIALRYAPSGSINDMTGPGIFADEETLSRLQGFCNSQIVEKIAELISPTLDFQPGQVASYPIIKSSELNSGIDDQVNSCRDLSKTDWDSFETSWDFKRHPLV